MLPDYIIYDELKRERRKRDHDRPRLEIETPQHRPPQEDSEFEDQDRSDDAPERKRGVEILQM